MPPSELDRLVPIERGCTLLFPAAETSYCWGFLEGLPASYSLVRVDGRSVQVQWCVLGRGVLREYAWQEPGRLTDVGQPQLTRRPVISEAQLRQAKDAAFVFRPWAEQRTPITIALNGEPVTQTQVGPSYNMFWEEHRIAIPQNKLPCLRMINCVEIGNPERAIFGVANLRLEVRLADGTLIATPVCGDFSFSCRRSQAGKQARAWEIAPQDRIREAELGQSLGLMEVRFSE